MPVDGLILMFACIIVDLWRWDTREAVCLGVMARRVTLEAGHAWIEQL